ncbi:MAG: hypothetical protein ACI9H8_000316 [Lysobacterales bacterium]|jgi:hypothetical protein
MNHMKLILVMLLLVGFTTQKGLAEELPMNPDLFGENARLP